jgi:hypothetical protein
LTSSTPLAVFVYIVSGCIAFSRESGAARGQR